MVGRRFFDDGIDRLSRVGHHRGMLPPAIEKLLVFQDRDQRRAALESLIVQVPVEFAAVRR